MGRLDEAEKMYRQAQELAGEDCDYPFVLGDIIRRIGTLYVRRGRYEEALALFGQALRYFETAEHSRGYGEVLTSKGTAFYLLNQHRRAAECYADAIFYLDPGVDSISYAATVQNLAVVTLEMGSLDTLSFLHGKLRALLKSSKIPKIFRERLRWIMGSAEIRFGYDVAAVRSLRKVMQRIGDRLAPHERATLRVDLAQALYLGGDLPGCLDELELARATLESIDGIHPDAVEAVASCIARVKAAEEEPWALQSTLRRLAAAGK